MPLTENSPAIFQMGVSLVADAMTSDPAKRAQAEAMGGTVAQILQNRFFQQQAEDFKNNELAAFMQAASQFGQNYGMMQDPDKAVGALMDFKNSVMLPFITSTSLKYSKNETIMNTARTVFESGPKLADYIGVQGMKIDQQQANAATMNAETAKAQAATQSRLAGLKAQELALQMPINANMSAAEILQKVRSIPPDERGDKDFMAGLAKQRVQMRSGKWDPVRGKIVGDPTPEGVKSDEQAYYDELDALPTPTKNLMLERAAVERLGGQEALAKFGGYFDSVSQYFDGKMGPEDVQPMRGAVSDQNVIAVALGKPSAELNGIPISDMKSFVKEYVMDPRVVTMPSQMGDQFFAAYESALRPTEVPNVFLDRDGNRVEFSPTDWKGNQERLAGILMENYNHMVTSVLVENDSNSRSTREKVKAFGAAGIARFTSTKARQLGIPVTEPLSPRTAPPPASSGLWPGAKAAIFGEDAAWRAPARAVGDYLLNYNSDIVPRK